MTTTNNSSLQNPQISLVKRMLAGAAIGLLLIAFFLFSARRPNPAWGSFWMIRPLIIAPLAGAMAGLCNYFIIYFHKRVGVNKIIAIILSGFVFIVGLWLGIVLGLAGTMWN